MRPPLSGDGAQPGASRRGPACHQRRAPSSTASGATGSPPAPAADRVVRSPCSPARPGRISGLPARYQLITELVHHAWARSSRADTRRSPRRRDAVRPGAASGTDAVLCKDGSGPSGATVSAKIPASVPSRGRPPPGNQWPHQGPGRHTSGNSGHQTPGPTTPSSDHRGLGRPCAGGSGHQEPGAGGTPGRQRHRQDAARQISPDSRTRLPAQSVGPAPQTFG